MAVRAPLHAARQSKSRFRAAFCIGGANFLDARLQFV